MKNRISDEIKKVFYRIEKKVFFIIHTKELPKWTVYIALRLFGYNKFKSNQVYANQSEFWKISKLRNVNILRSNVIVSSSNEIVIQEEFPPINSEDTKIVLISGEYYLKNAKKNERTKLQIGYYASSRKQEIFYHGINWVLTKIIELGFFESNSYPKKILLIEASLHWRIKEFLIYCVESGISKWDIFQIEEGKSIILEEINFVTTLQRALPENAFIASHHLEIIEKITKKENENLPKIEKIFLIRNRDARSQNFRKLINSHEIEELVFNEGFSLIDLGEYTLIDQIKIISNARILIGYHGGNFTLNPFAAKNNPKIIEIFCGLISDCFEIQTKNLGLEYQSFFAEKTSGGFFLDPLKISQLLKKLKI